MNTHTKEPGKNAKKYSKKRGRAERAKGEAGGNDQRERKRGERAEERRGERTPQSSESHPAETCPSPRARSPVPVPRRDMPEPPSQALAPLFPFFPTPIVCMGLFSFNYKSISVIYFYLSPGNSIIFTFFPYIFIYLNFSPYLCNSLNL